MVVTQDSDENEQITTMYNDVDESHKQNVESNKPNTSRYSI